MVKAFTDTHSWLIILAFIIWFAANVVCLIAINRRRWIQPTETNGGLAIFSSKLSALRIGLYMFPLPLIGVTGAILEPDPLTAVCAVFFIGLFIAAVSQEWGRTGKSASIEWSDDVVSGPSNIRGFRLGPRNDLRIDQLVGIARQGGGNILLENETHKTVEFSSSWEGHNHLLQDLYHSKPEIFNRYLRKRWFKELMEGPPSF